MTGPSYAALADAGWPALERAEVGGWRARFSHGVTKRANSAWWAGEAGAGAGSGAVAGATDASAGGIAEVEAAYRARGLPPVFQLTGADEAAARRLIGRGYALVDETVVMAAPVREEPAAAASVSVTRTPSEEWLDAWWAVDGRGGPAEREVARAILTGVPALYAALPVDGVVAAVARVALVGSWGGLYCVATLPRFRRRGLARQVVAGALAAGAAHGVTDAWLQVLARNEAALALYSGFGFTEVERYRYLIGKERPLPVAVCR
ncbi:GNAT family N-acetyltransferase [Gryllotalpicola ginsengisoli]|uniref:GNAT family N-acetyltransferase n=1 Tax=Gryllotalpicola ginsengisoli TaxID=444608 RepID=UPI0003B3A675|nr:GNAT family N-acetyltransferase [Gryllotalpicola ginsengisoli]